MTVPHWTPEALEKLKRAPFFVRPFAKRKIEAEARAQNLPEITAEFVEQLRRKQHE